MAENETSEQQVEDGGRGTRTAVKAAAAAAATGAAAVAVKKALSSDSNGKSKSEEESGGRGRRAGSGELLASVASGGWEAAREHLLPLAEDAAGAAGSYLARSGPDVVREKIVPRFISGFQNARGGGD